MASPAQDFIEAIAHLLGAAKAAPATAGAGVNVSMQLVAEHFSIEAAPSRKIIEWFQTDARAGNFINFSLKNVLGRLNEFEAFGLLVELHFQVLQQVASKKFVDAYDTHEKLVTEFHHGMDFEDFAWSRAVMHALYVDLRRLALQADANGGRRTDKAADKLRQGFSKVSNDKSALETSRKWAALHVINQIFKLLFSINQLSVGLKNLRRWVDSPLCPNHKMPIENRGFARSQVVTYRYYCGRIALYEDNFDEARKDLEYAFCHCHAKAAKNKRNILQYLIPVKMLYGQLPSKELLAKYSLECYEDVTEAVRDGNLHVFNLAMAEHQAAYIRTGVYLVIEKLKIVILRNFFKKVHLLSPAPKHQVKLELCKSLLEALQVRYDLDELECVLANLIYGNYIKGYVSHAKRVLVLSKANPFPSARLQEPPRTAT